MNLSSGKSRIRPVRAPETVTPSRAFRDVATILPLWLPAMTLEARGMRGAWAGTVHSPLSGEA